MAKEINNAWIQLASAGVQMGVIIYIFVWIGKYLDEQYSPEDSWFTMLGAFLGIAVSIYMLIITMKKINS